MKELLQEVIEMKENHSFLYDRDVAIFVPPIMYLRYLPKTTNPTANVKIYQAKMSGQAMPHFSHVVIINKLQIDKRVLGELTMVPDKVNGKKPIVEYVDIYE